MTQQFRLYTKKGCPWCVRAKSDLSRHDLKFEEIDLSSDTERKKFYGERGVSTVPQIYRLESKKEVEHIGGSDDLALYLKRIYSV